MTLVELYNQGGYDTYPTDKGTVHSYLPVYDELFTPYRNKEINLFEVGYYKGGSARLWEDYFTKAQIKVIDIVPQDYFGSKFIFKSARVQFEQKDVRRIQRDYFDDFQPDIIIDDGSHLLITVARLIRVAFPILRTGGLYIVEDFNVVKNRRKILEIGIPFEVIDRREVSGREDDVLLIFRK
jgi:hypothetical protein